MPSACAALAARQAGHTPARATTSATAITAKPALTASKRYSSIQYGGGSSDMRSASMVACPPSQASTLPISSAASAITSASLRQTTISRERLAPMAARIAVSRVRCTPRAIIRLATLTQAMASTSSTAANMVPSTWRVLRPTNSSR